MKNTTKSTDESAKKSVTSGSSKEKASFDQNGEGASEKYGQAGSVPNESGKANSPGTAKKNENTK